MFRIRKKYIQRGLCSVSISVLFVAAFLMLSARFSLPGGYRLYAVLSGSMDPAIPVGSLVIMQIPREDIVPGQVITFEESSSQRLVTHRIVEKLPTGLFVTQGDANPRADAEPVAYGTIKGVYWQHVPYVGRVLEFIKSPRGLLLLVGLPALFIILQELRTILAVLVERKTNQSALDAPVSWLRIPQSEPLPFMDSVQATHVMPPERRPHKIRVTLIFTAGLLAGISVLTSSSYAIFTASEVAINQNTLATALLFPSPTPSVSPLPSPPPSPCGQEIDIDQSNTNTGPGSVNENETVIETECEIITETTSTSETNITIKIY